MPNAIRADIPGHSLHVIHRGRLRRACFVDDEDCAIYRGWLVEFAARFACCVHAYALMRNHVHLLLTPSRTSGVAGLMRALDEHYARYVCTAHHCDGALWEDHYEAVPVHVGRYLLACMRYIELNPVRARVVLRPEQYRWSSFRANALGHDDALLTPHAHYCALGRSVVSRQAAYRELFRHFATTAPSRRTSTRATTRDGAASRPRLKRQNRT